MRSYITFICLLLGYNVTAQDCTCGLLPSNLPLPLKNLLSFASPIPLPLPPCGCLKSCGCPELCGLLPPIVPPCGFNPAVGLPNPAIGLPNPIVPVTTCGCGNAFGACACGAQVLGNLCGRNTPTVGLATTCGCSDPSVRVVDGCPRCQSVYSYNLPSIGYSTGSTEFGGVVAPSFLPPCGCSGSLAPYGVCGCAAPSCNCGGCGCGCGGCGCGCGGCGCSCGCGCGGCGCAPVNPCGCVEVPCGLPKVKTTCTCVTPTIETPFGCAQGKPTCACATTLEVPTCGVPVVPPFPPVIGCSRYLRQVCVQPPFM
ncbi:keratin-associated protein 5-10-like [Leguminivora glycinivorella]|uniref:keratin-associated protein 5-10-like n=1 Tax=Leguminivora glycinivorella TaxID=1035111 RepID=UPI00200FB8AE|nr:keratin-associated protein 5-10-like [Leguminivora glycinivorella]